MQKSNHGTKTPAPIIYSYRLLLSNTNVIYNPAYIISQHIYIETHGLLQNAGSSIKTQSLHKSILYLVCSFFRMSGNHAEFIQQYGTMSSSTPPRSRT